MKSYRHDWELFKDKFNKVDSEIGADYMTFLHTLTDDSVLFNS